MAALLIVIVTSYSSDALGRMVSASDSALGKTIGYAYDKRGLRRTRKGDGAMEAAAQDRMPAPLPLRRDCPRLHALCSSASVPSRLRGC